MKREVNHIDGDKTNNLYTNLEWVTSQENQIHAVQSGAQIIHKGEKNGKAKLKEYQVLEIREKYKLGTFYHRELAEMYNVSRETIGDIVNRKSWKHI